MRRSSLSVVFRSWPIWVGPGGNIGGPVPGMKNKMFFFAGYEYYWQKYVDTSQTLSSFVPTLSMRSGNFSSTAADNAALCGTSHAPWSFCTLGTGVSTTPLNGVEGAGNVWHESNELRARGSDQHRSRLQRARDRPEPGYQYVISVLYWRSSAWQPGSGRSGERMDDRRDHTLAERPGSGVNLRNQLWSGAGKHRENRTVFHPGGQQDVDRNAGR